MTMKSDDEIGQLADNAHTYFMQAIMALIGRYYIADTADVDTSPAEIARIRREIFLPITNAAFLAALDCMWITAPPDATREQAEEHGRMLLAECMKHVGQGRELGHFWLHIAMQEERPGTA